MSALGTGSQRGDPPEGPFDLSTLPTGVEEEYLLVDPVTRQVAPESAVVVKNAAVALGAAVTTELGRCQVEAQTPPCRGLGELQRALHRIRTEVTSAAVTAGVRAIATGAAPLAGAAPMRICDEPRYRRQLENYRGLVDEHLICACQVHVSVPDRERAVLVSNHLRPWIPVLTALTANSPYTDGRDTGYASWRRMVWHRWPVAGPPPYFSCYEDYRRLVQTLIDSGTLVDGRTLFWDIRLSSRYPTLEVRAADMPLTAEESAVYATVVGALAVTASRAVEHGDPGPVLCDELLRAACWTAARDGLRGTAVDPRTGKAVDAATLVDVLLEHIQPVLADFAEHRLLTAGLRRLAAAGTGADRQRAAFASRGRMTDVVDFLISQTPAAFPD